MKKVLLFLGVICTVVSCDKAKQAVEKATEAASAVSGKEKIDYQVLSNEAESKKWYDAIVEKIGANAKVCNEVRFSVSRPSMEGMIRREGQPDNLMITANYQDPADKRRIEEISYYSEMGWRGPEKKEIRVIGGNAENFKLEDKLFDFSEVTYDIFKKVSADAMAKYKDDAKYEYQYISSLDINKKEINVTVKGKLKSNAQEKSETYHADLKGNPKK